MTTFNETVNWEALSRMYSHEIPNDEIGKVAPYTAAPEVTFTTDPQGTMYTLVVGGDTYNLDYRTPPGEDIEFTASVKFSDVYNWTNLVPRAALEYHWDFGDGTEGWGNPVTHEYELTNINIRVVLRVTFDTGLRLFVGKQLYVTD